MSYDWRDEVASIRRQATAYRLQAAEVRHEAEKRASALEADADRTEMRADGIEAMCSRRGPKVTKDEDGVKDVHK